MAYAELYYKITHKDGRVENYHIYMEDMSLFAEQIQNLLNDKTCKLKPISKKQFKKEAPKLYNKVNINKDLNKLGDALGECIGYLEHYQL